LGRNDEDLLQEALASVCSDNDGRRWNPSKVDFIGFLRDAMKSIASNWRAKVSRSGAQEISGNGWHSDTNPSPLALAKSTEADPERQARAADLLRKIEDEFSSDETVQQVIAGLEMGLTGPEVMEIAEISENEYRAAVKRLRRGAKRVNDREEVS